LSKKPIGSPSYRTGIILSIRIASSAQIPNASGTGLLEMTAQQPLSADNGRMRIVIVSEARQSSSLLSSQKEILILLSPVYQLI
jgi:hypothetical protein